jgi:hypothetical protein
MTSRSSSEKAQLARRASRAVVVAAMLLVGDARVHADLENGVFTSKSERVRLVVPRGWRATELPSYPGMLLWMLRSQPEGTITLAAEPFTRRLYCSWPTACRSPREPLAAQYACALRGPLTAAHLRVGPIQAGPRDNAEAGLPSVWFEYDDGKHFVRQALAIGAAHAMTLVLATATADGRSAHVRAFEQALRSLRALSPDEARTAAAAVAATVDAGAPGAPHDAGVAPGGGDDGGATVDDGGAAPLAAPSVSLPPTPDESPVGPCPTP